MPLPQPQVIDVDMGLGLDTFTDPKRVMPGKFTQLENVRFQRGKRLEMRRGNVAYGGTYKIGNTGSATDSFGVFNNRLIVERVQTLNDKPVFFGEHQDAPGSGQRSGSRFVSTAQDKQTAASRLPIKVGTSQFLDGALVNTCRVAVQYSPPSRYDIACVDSALAGSTIVSIWAEYTGAQYQYFCDFRSTDGELINSSFPVSLINTTFGGGWCKAVAVSATKVWLLYPNNSTTSVRLVIVDVAAQTVSAASNYAVASLLIDAITLGSEVFIVAHDFDGGVGVVVKSGLVSWNAPAALTAKVAYGVPAPPTVLAFARPESGATKLRVLWRDNDQRGASFTASTGATVAGPTILGAWTAAAQRISCVVLGDQYIWVAVSFYDASAPHTSTTTVYNVRENGAWGSLETVQTVIGVLYSHMLARTDTDTASFWVSANNAAFTESAYYQYQVQNRGCVVSAKQNTGRAVPFNGAASVVANHYAISSTVERVAVLDSYVIRSLSASTKEVVRQIATISSDYDIRRPLSSVQIGDALVLGGGFTGMWDGKQLAETGFLGRPTIATGGVVTSTVGGFMSNGTYSFIAVCEWVNANGDVMLSAPSDPLVVVLSGGTATQTITFAGAESMPFLGYAPISGSTVGRRAPRTRIYSTTNNGSTYYFCEYGTRTCSDTDLQTRELLYTFGGVLPNAMPDGAPVVGKFNDRALLSSSSDDGILYVMKPPSRGFGAEFSDELTIEISSGGGPVTAIVENVDKCCVFKANSIQVFTGEGYTASGAGGGYSPAETIHDTIGCPGPWAAVSTKIGVMFDSGGQGIWLLGRDLQLTWIGEAVDSFKDIEVQRALAVPEQDEVRFLLTNETTLVYTISTGTWAVFTNTPCWDLGLAAAEPIWLRKSASNLGGVYVESDTVFTDFMNGVIDVSAATMTMTAVMGWLNLAGLQGYMRVWRALFTGDYGDSHTLLIDAGYDYDESTYPDSFSLTSANIGLPYDGQVWLRRGYSKAVRLRLRASSSAGDTVGPMSLTGLSFEVGILPRGARMKASKGA